MKRSNCPLVQIKPSKPVDRNGPKMTSPTARWRKKTSTVDHFRRWSCATHWLQLARLFDGHGRQSRRFTIFLSQIWRIY